MKEKILDKATELFLSRGFKSVTMDDLAQELGISKKTIYTHFSNKTQIVKESVMQLFDQIAAGIEHICSLGKNPIEELYEIKKFAMTHLKDEQSSPQYQLQKYYPAIFETVRKKQFELMQDCVVKNLKIGIEQGIYRENINIEFVARIYFSGVNSIKDPNLFPADLFTAREIMDIYLEYHLRGIITPKGRNILNEIINSNQL
ncbi:TetR/AcrR family transcriptional regulator [Zeaxanthinibacter enoshimensis]|uniref:AcrR family transcriptional regulator n=1 Tax=Zeaxanthinibacter enoshimensis TaxID=392009 RepID=A0A4R6TQ67_9FLAO|nr:TetR/AcrR family transcriptional regulator [Zeaxanthinibacter enoshimensis]TDQ32586.1 AcrR family transcriptional regulator [Zeaxanthinibacter enoshimensis]